MTSKHWYNVELTREKAEHFRNYLKSHNVKFEPSEAYNLIHFQCYMTPAEQLMANKYLYNLHLTQKNHVL